MFTDGTEPNEAEALLTLPWVVLRALLRALLRAVLIVNGAFHSELQRGMSKERYAQKTLTKRETRHREEMDHSVQ